METFSTTEDMKIEFSKINGNLNQLIVLQPFTNSEDPSNIIGDDQTLMLGEPSLVDIRLLSPTEETTLAHPSITAVRLTGLAPKMFLHFIEVFWQYKKMGPISK